MGGMVLETNMNEIVSRYLEQDKLEKSEVWDNPWSLFTLLFMTPQQIVIRL